MSATTVSLNGNKLIILGLIASLIPEEGRADTNQNQVPTVFKLFAKHVPHPPNFVFFYTYVSALLSTVIFFCSVYAVCCDGRG